MKIELLNKRQVKEVLGLFAFVFTILFLIYLNGGNFN